MKYPHPKSTESGFRPGRMVLVLSVLLLLSACHKNIGTSEAVRSNDPENLKLKDYRPESIYNLPVTMLNKAAFRVIDMHSHSYSGSRDEVDDWIRTMDETGITKIMVLTMKYGAAFDSVMGIYSRYPDRFSLWCGLDYSAYKDSGFAKKAIAELEHCHELGATGVGELGDKGQGLYYSQPPAIGMHPDDRRMDPVWEKCGELGMPVNIHVADPKWMYEPMDSTNDGLMNAYKWRLDNKPGIAGHDQMIDILERTVKKHPNTVFIACHVANCSYDLKKAARLLDAYPNLYMDISARFAELCAIPRTTRKFVVKYQDRLLYGTDMGNDPAMYRITYRLLETEDEHIYDSHFSYHWALSGLDLPAGVLEKLYRLNALKILHQD